MKQLAAALTKLGTLTVSPIATLVVLAYAVLWFVFQRSTFEWHGVATLATWFMTLVIQRSEHRDTQAIHAKLDELLKANEQARAGLTTIDEEEPEDVEKFREQSNDRS